MLLDGPRLGIHLALAAGMAKAADRAAELGLAAIQIFGDNPTAWRRRAEPSPELPAFRARLAEASIEPVVIHASYLVNPAGPPGPNRERSIEVLASELGVASGFGASLVNVHIGSHVGAGVDAGIAAVVEVLRQARDLAAQSSESGARLPGIALENSAGGGFGLGVDVAELAAIAGALEAAGFDRTEIGFCLDTAHAWGAGHDLSDPASVDRLLDQFDRRLGLDRLRLVHLNDSSSALGSRADRHQHVGAGRIGSTGLGHLLRDPRLAGLPVILETPGMEDGYDAVNVERARMLLRGEALPDLPPEAFQLRGSRTRAAIPPEGRGTRRSRTAVGTPTA